MPRQFEFQFLNFDKRGLGAVMGGSQSREFAQNIGKSKRDLARRLAPVDTGTLRSSIKFRTVDDRESGWIVYVYAEADYAIYVEYGTVTHSAQPFLRPALFSMIDRGGESRIPRLNVGVEVV